MDIHIRELVRVVSPDDQSRVLEGQLRECFGRVVYSHKTHEKCADLLLAKHRRIKFWQITLSALTTTAVIGQILGKSPIVLSIAAFLSTVLVCLNSYTKDYDLGKVAEQHREAANKLWDLRESYLSLLIDQRAGLASPEKLIARRDELQKALVRAYTGAPPTDSKAYGKAQEALKVREDLTFSDQEIDSFLPQELHRS